jgi:hypothetical protein
MLVQHYPSNPSSSHSKAIGSKGYLNFVKVTEGFVIRKSKVTKLKKEAGTEPSVVPTDAEEE